METGEFLRVLVDDVDVTAHCFEADDGEGWADCYRVDAEGRRYVDRASPTRAAAVQRHVGTVRFVGSPATAEQLALVGSGDGSGCASGDESTGVGEEED